MSADLHLGLSYGMASIPGFPGLYQGAALRYNLTPTTSMEGGFDIGYIQGKQSIAIASGSNKPDNFRSYSNHFNLYTLNFQFNLNRMFRLRRVLKRINPYLTLGGGLISNVADAERSDGRLKHVEFLCNHGFAGLIFRYYLNPAFDLKVSASYNFAQSYFMDAIPSDKKYDLYVLTSIGVNYKIGANKASPHVEWEDVIVEEHPTIKQRIKKWIDKREELKIIAQLEKSKKAIELAKNQPKEKIAPLSASAKIRKAKEDSVALIKKAGPAGKSKVPTDSLKEEAVEVLTKEDVADLSQKANVMDSLNGVKNKVDSAQAVGVLSNQNNKDAMDSVLLAGQTEISKPKKPSPAEEPLSSGMIVASAPPQTYVPAPGIVIAPPYANEESKVNNKPHSKELNPMKKGGISNRKIVRKPAELVKADVKPKEDEVLATIDKKIPSDTSVVPATKAVAQKAPEKVVKKEIHAGEISEPEVKSKGIATSKSPSREIRVPETSHPEIIAPQGKYNVIVGSYTSVKLALLYSKQLRRKGYHAQVLRSHALSRMLRIAVYSGNERKRAFSSLTNARLKVDKGSWIHVYEK